MTIDSKDLVYFFKQQIDTARTRPTQIVSRLQQRKFPNQLQYEHSQLPNIHYKVMEGPTAVQETIQLLSLLQPTHALILSQSLCEVAHKIGQQIAKYRTVQHPEEYLQRIDQQLFRTGAKSVGTTEIIVQYGFRRDSDIIPSILVSDGDRNRTNRSLLLSNLMKYVGISVHQHSEYDYMLIILLSSDIEESAKCQCTIF